MIVVDTNVFSALLLPRPIPEAVAWFDTQPRSELWTTSITVFELLRGAMTTPGEAKRHRLVEGVFDLLDFLDGRFLPLDHNSARIAGDIFGRRHWSGFNVAHADTLIGAIVVSRDATIATRNVQHFSDLGVRVVNPWGPDDPGPDA